MVFWVVYERCLLPNSSCIASEWLGRWFWLELGGFMEFILVFGGFLEVVRFGIVRIFLFISLVSFDVYL